MAIVHTFTVSKDQYILDVSQDTAYSLVYISNNNPTSVITGNLLTDNSVILPVDTDGFYRLTLVVSGETDVIIDFHVKYNLRNSIIIDAKYLLCDDCNCYDSILNCVTAIAKKTLKYKAILVKLLAYQNVYIPLYATSYSNDFQAFITSGLNDINCNVQKAINTLLMQECITGDVKNIDLLFKQFFSLYYLGMYAIEQKEAPNQDELDYLATAFKYDSISDCICNLGIKADTVLATFPENTEGVVVYNWQFTDTDTDIAFAPSIGLPYLSDKSTTDLADFLNGLVFTYSNIGRIAFAITNITEDQYRIEDTFGEDVTSLVFDSYWNAGLNMQVYISKEFYSLPSIYYQLIEN